MAIAFLAVSLAFTPSLASTNIKQWGYMVVVSCWGHKWLKHEEKNFDVALTIYQMILVPAENQLAFSHRLPLRDAV